MILFISQCSKSIELHVVYSCVFTLCTNTHTDYSYYFLIVICSSERLYFVSCLMLFFSFLKVNLSFQLDEQQRFPSGTHLDGGKHKVHGCTLPWRQTSGFFSDDVLLKEYRDQDKVSAECSEIFFLSNSDSNRHRLWNDLSYHII